MKECAGLSTSKGVVGQSLGDLVDGARDDVAAVAEAVRMAIETLG